MAEDFVRNNSKNPWSIRGMTREERSDYPYKAVREVLVNALIHQDYQILGSEIHMEVFDDRLEITSPGGMMNGRRVQDMDIRHIPSMRRNQIISDVDFFVADFYGKRRICRKCRIYTFYIFECKETCGIQRTTILHDLILIIGHSNQCRQVVVGWGDFICSRVSARILHGHTGCTGGFSLQNSTRDAQTAQSKNAVVRHKMAI